MAQYGSVQFRRIQIPRIQISPLCLSQFPSVCISAPKGQQMPLKIATWNAFKSHGESRAIWVYVSLFLPTKLKYLRVDLHVSQLYATQNMIVRWSDQKPKPNWNRTKKTTRLNPIIKLVCMSLSSSSLLVVLFACMWCINLEKTNAHPLSPANPISE